jgi:alginate O-acetyltransferase complex protein AlgI
MDSASFQFVLFGLTAAILSNFSRSHRWRSTVLMLTTFAFLALVAPQPLQFLPLAGFILFGYIGLAIVQRGTNKATAWVVIAVILAYIWLKKYTFLPEASFLRFTYSTLGLSYIFFRVLHLVIDSGDQDNQRIGIGAYLLYTLNFTTFVSGPIQRYEDFARDQFALEPIPLGPREIGLHLERIVRGLFKIDVVAMILDALRQVAITELSPVLPAEVRMFAAFRLAVIYPFFLYVNFSGYIDIVIALARLMRLRLPENFDRPFSATSFIDFWNRWHITLSTWLKTYVYNPLLTTLMRRISSISLEPLLGVFSFFVTFFLIGVWHGRTSEYMIFGVLQGTGVAINKVWQIALTSKLGRKRYRAAAANPFYVAFARGLTFSWFAFTLFWFWASWKQLDMIYSAVSVGEWLLIWLSVWMLATLVLALWEWIRAALLSFSIAGEPVLLSRYARVVYVSTLALVTFVITILLNQPAPEIVYKAF